MFAHYRDGWTEGDYAYWPVGGLPPWGAIAAPYVAPYPWYIGGLPYSPYTRASQLALCGRSISRISGVCAPPSARAGWPRQK